MTYIYLQATLKLYPLFNLILFNPLLSGTFHIHLLMLIEYLFCAENKPVLKEDRYVRRLSCNLLKGQ